MGQRALPSFISGVVLSLPTNMKGGQTTFTVIVGDVLVEQTQVFAGRF